MKAFCFHKKMAAMMTFTVRKEALPSISDTDFLAIENEIVKVYLVQFGRK